MLFVYLSDQSVELVVSRVERLAGLLGLPDRAGISPDWVAVEASLGVRLPDDYKELVQTFPDGWFQGLLQLNRPGDAGYSVDDFLGFYAHNPLGDMRSWRESGDGVFPYPIFPEAGGVLPWARARPTAGHFFWLTEGEDPNAWPVVMVDGEFTNWRAFDGSACDLLFEIVHGRFDASMFGAGLVVAGDPLFVPFPTPSQQRPLAQREPGPWYWTRIMNVQSGHPKNRFAELSKMVGLPPVEVEPVDWIAVERRLGFRLPDDYKMFAETYGPGTFCDISIAAPGASGDADLYGLFERSYSQLAGARRPGVPKAPIYPESGGIIPWGQTADGFTCCWLPFDNDPNKWGVSIPLQTGGIRHYPDLSFSSFLADYAMGVDIFPSREPWSDGQRFVPAGR